MGQTSDERQARDMISQGLKDGSVIFVRENAHGKIYSVGPRGERISLPQHQGDVRAWKNKLADIRRAYRDDSQEQEIEMDQPEGQDPLEAFGIFRQTIERKIVTDRFTIDLSGLARLLRLDGGRVVEVKAKDVLDKESTKWEGPIEIEITREIEG